MSPQVKRAVGPEWNRGLFSILGNACYDPTFFLVKTATVTKVYDVQLCFVSRHHSLLLHCLKVSFLVMNSFYTVQFRIAKHFDG